MMEATPVNNWPRRSPLLVYIAALAGVVFCGWRIASWHSEHVGTIQGYYLSSYARLAIPPVPGWNRFDLLKYQGAWATAADPEDGPFTVQRKVKVHREAFEQFLRTQVYGNQTLWEVLYWPLLEGGLFLVMAVIAARVWETRRNARARNGVPLHGSRIVSAWRFNWDAWRRRKRGFYIETK